MDFELLWDAAKAVLRNGDAFLLGAVSTGNAVRVAVYHGKDEPEKDYAKNAEELNAILSHLRDNPLSEP